MRFWQTVVMAGIFGLLAVNFAGAVAPAEAGPSAERTLWQPYRITPRTGAQHVSLNGPWQLGWRDVAVNDLAELNGLRTWFSAEVPSTVQWALYRAGKLPHPYQHLNSAQYAWVDEKVWYYRTSFVMPKVEGSSYVFLCFDGIDYFARVWLNGRLLGRHEGMFGGPDIEISKQLRPGAANEVVAEVRAANYGNKLGWKPRGPEGTAIKPWVIAGGTGGEMFFPLGMWQGARIEIVPQGHIERPFLVTKEAGEKEARLSLQCELFVAAQSLEATLHPWKNAQLADGSRGWRPPRESGRRFALRVQLVEKGGDRNAFDRTFPLATFGGRNFLKQDFKVAKPKLWWPNGMGAASLYRAKLTLLCEGGATDRLEFDCGIRTIQTAATAGPRGGDRWADWQFVVNGRPLFVKGMNWMPADLLLDLPRERYRWLIGAARAAGIQLFRVWGGGLLETEEFYDACNDLGIMVWQDFPIGNRDTPQWPQQVWEAQVLHTIFRLRNHPSLALYCGGNEFNPYSPGNAATMGIWERALADFDPTRPFRRTSPDAGSIHTYPDMDPTWYGKLYRFVPWIAETGMHNVPEPQGIRELVAAAELDQPLGGMLTKEFPRRHPELMQHFVEYSPDRVPRMLSPASHVADMTAPTLETLAEATQIAAGEFYQIVSEQLQANYPVTAGLIPWVYKRPWPVIAIMLLDGFGQPTAPYYFLKRSYEPTHILVKLPQLLWAKGEEMSIPVCIAHASPAPLAEMEASVEVLDAAFASRWRKALPVSLKAGPSVAALDLGGFTIPDSFENTFFFIVAELRGADRRLVSRSVYWPRCLARMRDEAFRKKVRQSPQPMLALDHGPWLKPQAAAQPTSLQLTVTGREDLAKNRSRIQIRVRNTGHRPACNTRLDIENAARCFYATDNFFWLAPAEERVLELQVLWREPAARRQAVVSVEAWNAKADKKNLSD
jgi:beta-mannosidase